MSEFVSFAPISPSDLLAATRMVTTPFASQSRDRQLPVSLWIGLRRARELFESHSKLPILFWGLARPKHLLGHNFLHGVFHNWRRITLRTGGVRLPKVLDRLRREVL